MGQRCDPGPLATVAGDKNFRFVVRLVGRMSEPRSGWHECAALDDRRPVLAKKDGPSGTRPVFSSGQLPGGLTTARLDHMQRRGFCVFTQVSPLLHKLLAQHRSPGPPHGAHSPGLFPPPAPPAPPAPDVIPVQVEPVWHVPPGQQLVPTAPQDLQKPEPELRSHPRPVPQEFPSQQG
jgi:hypothetical protein